MQNEVNKSITIIILLPYYSLITRKTGASKNVIFGLQKNSLQTFSAASQLNSLLT